MVRYSLLHLVAAVGAGQVDDEAQFLGCVVHVLSLEGTLLCFVRPRQALVDVHQPIEGATDGNYPPPSCLRHLLSESDNSGREQIKKTEIGNNLKFSSQYVF